MTNQIKSALPNYHKSINWDRFFDEYPVPDVWSQTIRTWSPERVQNLQEQRFKKILEIGWKNPFYRRRWTAAGLQPGDVQSLNQITRLPTYNSDDVKQDQIERPPFGDFHGLSDADRRETPLKVQTSGGTTGTPRPTVFGPVEWELNGLSCARVMFEQGARPGDVCQIPVSLTLANLGWCVYKGCHDYLGVLPVTTGSGLVTSSVAQIERAFSYGSNIWVCFPEYMTTLAKVARDEYKRDFRELKTKFIGSFLGPDIEGTLRRSLEDLLGCTVYDYYGTNEIGGAAAECRHKDGLHFMEDLLYFEVLDTETGKPVPKGEIGNLVVTSLYRAIPPIIRFNLRDLGRILHDSRCDCGSAFRRMDHFLGRSDEMIRLRGVNFVPQSCLSAIKSDKRTSGEWLCVLDRIEKDGVLREEMTVRVEVKSQAGALDGLADHLRDRLKTDLGLKVDVELVPEGSLAEFSKGSTGEGKARRILDHRPGYLRK